MLYTGITTSPDNSNKNIKIVPLFSYDENISNWKALINLSNIEIDLNKDNSSILEKASRGNIFELNTESNKLLQDKNLLVKFSTDPHNERKITNAEFLDDGKLILIINIPANYPPVRFIRSIRKIEFQSNRIKNNFLLREGDALYSSFKVSTEYSNMLKFEAVETFVSRIRLCDIEKDLHVFMIPDKGGHPLNFILKEDLAKFNNLLMDKGDIIFIEDPREVFDKHDILENFNLTNKSGFNVMINYYKLQSSEKRLQKEIEKIDKKKLEIENELSIKSGKLEDLSKDLSYLENNYIQKKKEYSIEIDSLEFGYLDKKEQFDRELATLEDNYKQIRKQKTDEIKNIQDMAIQKKDDVIKEIKVIENRLIIMNQQFEKLEQVRDNLKNELEQIKKEKKNIMELDENLQNREKKLQEETKKLESDQKLLEVKENLVKKEMIACEQSKKERITLDTEVKELKEARDKIFSELEAFKKELEPVNKELNEKRWKLEQIKGQIKELSGHSEEMKGENISILIVDDNKITRKLTTSILKKYNFELLEAGDGNSGMQMAKDNHPDIILMDLMLPDISGYEVTEKLKQLDNTADIPVIAFSALSEPASIMKAMKAGCCDYLVKPFKINEFLQKINKFLPSKQVHALKDE